MPVGRFLGPVGRGNAMCPAHAQGVLKPEPGIQSLQPVPHPQRGASAAQQTSALSPRLPVRAGGILRNGEQCRRCAHARVWAGRGLRPRKAD
eukprot:scaffold12017_cov120-Isochrysis_galbana.AAC.9